jgi:DNA-binding response OmpR family regulator
MSTTKDEPTKTAPDNRKKILLVEDDDGLASVYRMRLESEGFAVNRVANGENALSTAVEYKPDLVLLDVMMPKISGFEVLDILRNTNETKGIKVIIIGWRKKMTRQNCL